MMISVPKTKNKDPIKNLSESYSWLERISTRVNYICLGEPRSGKYFAPNLMLCDENTNDDKY